MNAINEMRMPEMIRRAYAAGVNPLPLLRRVFPGFDWAFEARSEYEAALEWHGLFEGPAGAEWRYLPIPGVGTVEVRPR